MARVKVVIPGVEKVDELIKRHYELLKELEDNTAQLYAERLELEVKLNQPEEKAPGAEAPDIKGITINLPD